MIIPAKRFFIVLTSLAGIGLFASLFPALETLWYIIAGLAFALAMLDILSLIRSPKIEIDRQLPGSLPLGVKQSVELIVRNNGHRAVNLQLYDHHPLPIEAEGLPITVALAANQQVTLTYQIKALERGTLHFSHVQTRLQSPYHFWWRNLTLGSSATIHSYPNFAAVAHYALLATDNKLSQMGIVKKRRRGEGQDFHQLREYRVGDSFRQIDWKASSRIQKIISREYQDERDQEIIFLLDCGHRMLAKDDELSHFDHTLNAILLLAYVALKQGDAVGISTFSGESRWLPPKKGLHHLQTLLNTIYDLQPSTASPDYGQAASDLMIRHKKRALVILVSNLRDEDTDDLLPALNLLKRRHLVLMSSMREQSLDEAMEHPIQDFDTALTHASLQHYAQYRQLSFEKLQASGVLSIDVSPPELSVGLINQYLSIKRSGQL